MPALTDPSTPARDRQASGAVRTAAISAVVAATDLFTVASPSVYDNLETGDIVTVTGTITGAAGLVLGQEYSLLRVSATTFKLTTLGTGTVLDVTTDMSAGSPLLTYGNPQAVPPSNIVAMGSPAGGGFAGPND